MSENTNTEEKVKALGESVEEDIKELNDEYQKMGGAGAFKLSRAQRRLLMGKRKKRL